MSPGLSHGCSAVTGWWKWVWRFEECGKSLKTKASQEETPRNFLDGPVQGAWVRSPVGERRSRMVHGQEERESAKRSPSTVWAASSILFIWQWKPWTLLCAQHPVAVSKRRVSALHGLTPKNLAEFPHIHLWIPSFSYKNSHNSSEENIIVNGALW